MKHGTRLGLIALALAILHSFAQPVRAQSAGDLYAGDTIVGNLRWVPATGPAGFTEGSPLDELCRSNVGEDQFQHILTRNLAVMETEVTQGAWAALRVLQPTLPLVAFNNPGGSKPAESITWYQAVLFANLLSAQQGLTPCYYTDASKTIPIDATNYLSDTINCDFDATGYRLPTEGEWEYFTRAGTTTPFSVAEPNYGTSAPCWNISPPGSLPALEAVAWFVNNTTTSQPVGMLLSNPWNLKDVHGNVWEWCWDWHSNPYPTGTVTDYAGAATGTVRILKGGGYRYVPRDLRSAAAVTPLPSDIYMDMGVRLVRTINPEPAAPSIISIKSRKAKPGSPATISGTGFSATKGENSVRFGRFVATVNNASTAELRVEIPSKCRSGRTYGVKVFVNGSASNRYQFKLK